MPIFHCHLLQCINYLESLGSLWIVGFWKKTNFEPFIPFDPSMHKPELSRKVPLLCPFLNALSTFSPLLVTCSIRRAQLFRWQHNTHSVFDGTLAYDNHVFCRHQRNGNLVSGNTSILQALCDMQTSRREAKFMNRLYAHLSAIFFSILKFLTSCTRSQDGKSSK